MLSGATIDLPSFPKRLAPHYPGPRAREWLQTVATPPLVYQGWTTVVDHVVYLVSIMFSTYINVLVPKIHHAACCNLYRDTPPKYVANAQL